MQRAPAFETLQSFQLFTSPITINFLLPASCAHVNPWKTRKRLRITHKAITRNLYTRRSSTWVYGTRVSARARVHERRRHFVCFCFTSHPTVPPLNFQPQSSLASAGKIFMRCMYMWQTCSAACFMDCKEHCFELFGLVMRYCRLAGWHRQVAGGGRENYENESFLLFVVA